MVSNAGSLTYIYGIPTLHQLMRIPSICPTQQNQKWKTTEWKKYLVLAY